ncbi:MAG: DEAD/DEAH box helicase [Anaerolineae bacterium]|nr:DEAD/DEAH box helicase [Anaerolineae bacterium]
MSKADPSFVSGDLVFSDQFGMGTVRLDEGLTVLVRFDHGVEECEKSTLRQVSTPLQAIKQQEWNVPLEVITRTQAEAIQSVNDSWGVFSLSRIALLPHQLWVCRQVLERWPTRWLVADDVGLGKTIEAGLILSPLIARSTVKRALIICPASLIEQWQERLREMFDLRFTRYTSGADTEKADFWNTNHQVIASIQTLRLDQNGRHNRLLQSVRWDMVLVDEAHHLNADEKSGPTLGYKLLERMVENDVLTSMVFFTGTPHRGKNFGFLSLLHLLRPDMFDSQQPMRDQLHKLREVMIRNNKQNVTDLNGKRLFKRPLVRSETYYYSPAEERFYQMLTEFIVTGKAYASTLSSQDDQAGRAVMLVLISMQKLASSSVAAIRRALGGRLSRIGQTRQTLNKLQNRLAKYEELEDLGDNDQLSALEEQFAELSTELRLMEDEESRLKELVTAADQVGEETKIKKLIKIVKEQFSERPILFFTEYKATQSLLMSALISEFGDDCVTFINGEHKAENVINSYGKSCSISEDRETAARKFNDGQVQYLVSTEAGGEGIDLQERCHTLIHVDLPWNPMRLHQRVGRLNRYGQTKQVEVVTLRNPATVESIIWEKLNTKIHQINLALDQVMDDPEDLLQLILGMTPNSIFREIFSNASNVKRDSLTNWFDEKTAQFGGKDVVDTVRDLVGNCASFDFQQISEQIPRLDLPDLKPFFLSMLFLNKRHIRQENGEISFITPEAWLSDPAIRTRYKGLVFDRTDRLKKANQVLGVGHKLLDQAISQAKESSACITVLPEKILEKPLFVYRITDRVTTETGTVRAVIVGLQLMQPTGEISLLQDWKLLDKLNILSETPGLKRSNVSSPPIDFSSVVQLIEEASQYLKEQLAELDLPFKIPDFELRAIYWMASESQE